MINQNKRGAPRVGLGGFRKKGSTVAAAMVLAVTPSVASAWYFICYGGSRHFVPLDRRPFYTPLAFSHNHSGYVPAGTQYDTSAFGHDHSGLVSNEDFWLPWGLKSQIKLYDQAKYDMAKQGYPYFTNASHSGASLDQQVRDYEEEKLKFEQRQADHRARVEQLGKDAEKRRQEEGLNEPALFRSYFESIGKYYNLATMRAANKTVALYVLFQGHPNLVVEWHDPDLMRDMLNKPGQAGYCRNYIQKIKGFIEQGMVVYQITEKDENKIIPKLEEIATRCSLGKKSN